MSVESTRATMMAYWQKLDPKYVADDAVYTNMATGEETKGREAIGQMLNYMYHQAFDARPETINTIFADGQAVVEANFMGKHIGEFAGIPATGKEVKVPLCVVYNLEDDKIKKARVYFQTSVLFQQLGVQ